MPDRARVLVAIAGPLLASCAASSGDPPPPEPLAAASVTFTPPSPRGCSAASAYDYCFAFDGGTPLAVRVALPGVPPEKTHGVVRFHRKGGAPAAVLDAVEFVLPVAKADLVLYFQVYPATYTIDVAIAGATGTSDLLDVATEPIETAITLAR